MLTVADRGRAVGKICQNLADVICEIQINDIEICTILINILITSMVYFLIS